MSLEAAHILEQWAKKRQLELVSNELWGSLWIVAQIPHVILISEGLRDLLCFFFFPVLQSLGDYLLVDLWDDKAAVFF